MTRPLGRPRLDPEDHSVQVNVSVPSKQFERLCQQARKDDISIAEAIRRSLGAVIISSKK